MAESIPNQFAHLNGERLNADISGLCCLTQWTALSGEGGALPKNMWRVCAATLTPIFQTPVTEWPLFIFHILLSPNDPHFQNALSLNDPPFEKYLSVKMGVMLSLNDTIFTNKWPPHDMYPIFLEGEIYVVAK